MKNLFSLIFVIFSGFYYSQISVGLKANAVFQAESPNFKSIKNTTNEIISGEGDTNVGWNLGLSIKAGLGGRFFLMPEIYYTHFNTKFTEPLNKEHIKIKNNRIDIPLLVGYNLLDIIGSIDVFAGPVGSINTNKNESLGDHFKGKGIKAFSIGYQFGAQFQLCSLVFSARYEGAFTKKQLEYLNDLDEKLVFDNRPNLLIVGLGYRF